MKERNYPYFAPHKESASPEIDEEDIDAKEQMVIDHEITDVIGKKARRKLEARAKRRSNAWKGLGMVGLIGWSVVLPIIGCLALGIWIDNNYPSRFPWVLFMLFCGVAYGGYYGWYWIDKELLSKLKKKGEKTEEKEENGEKTEEGNKEEDKEGKE